MNEVIRVEDRYYIRADSSLADDRTRVLKGGETFAVFDRYGDVQPIGLGEQGVYHGGTRHLSSLVLRFGDVRPLLLSSTVRDDNAMVAVDLTNPDLRREERTEVPRGSLHLFRSKFLVDGACYERLRLTNYALQAHEVTLELSFAADFADLFEVRGMKRKARGHPREAEVDGDQVTLAYEGLDGVVRWSRLVFDPEPERLDGTSARFKFRVPPKQEVSIRMTLQCGAGISAPRPEPFEPAFQRLVGTIESMRAEEATIESSNEQFNDWLQRSSSDLRMMLTHTEQGWYPYAGVPWFSTIFGRDGIITALEYLWVDPLVARGVLAYLAEHQAKEVNERADAQPGKILHETRRGEMAALGEIPFGCYYGSVDSTPLFVVLAEAFYHRTGDAAFLATIWSNVRAALEWIERYGDRDGDGFVEYERQSPHGLVNQGWKDSGDAVFHADGSLARGPIALCEVQGYVFAAYRAGAVLAELFREPELATHCRERADRLRERFEEAFWCEEIVSYALALDGDKNPCRIKSSNPGHCLFSGIASSERALRTAETLSAPDMFCGWGIRTVSSHELRYDPMSYHNGSVWPHDNALVAAGLARYGAKKLASQVTTAIFDASRFVDLHRLPELFCGFDRRPSEGPTLYPVACNPQSWAAGAVFFLLQSCLGLSIEVPRSRVRFAQPWLPPFLRDLRIRNLRVGRSTLDLWLQRHEHDVGIQATCRDEPIEIVIVK